MLSSRATETGSKLKATPEISSMPVPFFVLTVAVLCLLTYLPMFDNGFISDDFVIIARLGSIASDPFFLFSEPPECFRFTSYVCFGALKFLFGYGAAAFYAFNLLVHVINSLLVWRLVTRLSHSEATGRIAAVLFAVMQGHQEAVMWLAAMNETLLGLFMLLCLLSWEAKRKSWSSLLYVPALFSKESALILMGLIPCISGRSVPTRRDIIHYCTLGCVSAGFIALFFTLASRNFMINTGTYSLGTHAITVFFNSMHRMLFPYVYLVVIIALWQRRKIGVVANALPGLGYAAIALLPYVFLTYDNHVTSRQEYLASIGIAWMLAALVLNLRTSGLRKAFVVIFILANICYIWFRKDAQFEIRAAPTGELIEILRERSPQKLLLVDFPYNPWVAKYAANMVDGWNPTMIHVNEPAPDDGNYLTFRWNAASNEYLQVKALSR